MGSLLLWLILQPILLLDDEHRSHSLWLSVCCFCYSESPVLAKGKMARHQPYKLKLTLPKFGFHTYSTLIIPATVVWHRIGFYVLWHINTSHQCQRKQLQGIVQTNNSGFQKPRCLDYENNHCLCKPLSRVAVSARFFCRLIGLIFRPWGDIILLCTSHNKYRIILNR